MTSAGLGTPRPLHPPRTALMRAARVVAPGVTTVVEVERPTPGPGEVRVRIEGSGVCASSAPVWEGRDWFTYPREAGAPGHEGWGVIDVLGEDVPASLAGQRVAVLSYRAFAQYDVAHADAVVPLPDALAGCPFPGEAFGCAMNAFARADVTPGQQVAVVGVGFLGATLVRLAAHAGARVIAISRRPSALALARAMGASEVIRMDDHQRILDRANTVTGRAGCARVFECVGLQWPLDLASELTGERGRLIIAGFHQDGPRQVNVQLWNWRGLDVINAHERATAAYVEGMRRAVDAVVSGVLDVQPLLTHAFPLDAVDDAFRMLAARPDGFCKAWITIED